MNLFVGQGRKKWIVFSGSRHIFLGCSDPPFSLSLPPYVDAMESSYGQAEYNEVMSSHVTLKPEAVLSSSSCTMASFTLFLEMDKSGVMQSPEEVEKKRKSTKYALK